MNRTLLFVTVVALAIVLPNCQAQNATCSGGMFGCNRSECCVIGMRCMKKPVGAGDSCGMACACPSGLQCNGMGFMSNDICQQSSSTSSSTTTTAAPM